MDANARAVTTWRRLVGRRHFSDATFGRFSLAFMMLQWELGHSKTCGHSQVDATA